MTGYLLYWRGGKSWRSGRFAAALAGLIFFIIIALTGTIGATLSLAALKSDASMRTLIEARKALEQA